MPERFVFRQVCSRDLKTFLDDGEIRAKNHGTPQLVHRTSYPGIVERRGQAMFPIPQGGVVNDYVPFYFSPISSFTYTIHKGNVDLRSPDGDVLGRATDDERIFFVCRISDFANSGATYCFSNLALNTNAPLPQLECDLRNLEDHIDWSVFDEGPTTARIPQLGYDGVCSYFANYASPDRWQNRSQKRMAEFLVKDAVPLTAVSCIIAKTPAMQQSLQSIVDASDWDIPVYANRGCFF